ncbi:MAG: hydrogenase formation protein HypD, partial [Planctomycetia bacterium]|nr:hydrogenase formation protein HypD [Planctomycetia bacterium]
MKYVDEYRDPGLARELLTGIRRRATKPWVLMEVCGGQTHSLLRNGIDAELEGIVELIHGPGCPVCVTPAEAIDLACDLARRPGVLIASFGDMLRVPGNHGSLLDVRTQGGQVRTVYSPLDAVELARREPDRQVVFFAVGFETTTPATALAVLQADRYRLENFSLLVAHVRVQPAM